MAVNDNKCKNWRNTEILQVVVALLINETKLPKLTSGTNKKQPAEKADKFTVR